MMKYVLLVLLINNAQAEPAISITDVPKNKNVVIVSCIKDNDNKQEFLTVKREHLNSQIVVDWFVRYCLDDQK